MGLNAISEFGQRDAEITQITRTAARALRQALMGVLTRAKSQGELIRDPLGIQRITDVRLVCPGSYQPVPAVSYLEKLGVVSVQPGKEWLLELTFDGGKQGKSKDLRRDLPLMLRYWICDYQCARPD